MGSNRSKHDSDGSASESEDEESSEESDRGSARNGMFGGFFNLCQATEFIDTDKLKRERLRSRLKCDLVDNTDKELDDYFTTKKTPGNDKGSQLGVGGFGTVYKGVNKKTGATRAIKELARRKDDKRLRIEVESMQRLDHPNIIRLFQLFEGPEKVYMIMEIADGGELFDRIDQDGKFTEQLAATVMRQIFRAIVYMHSMGVCHRDLKPENFLFQTKAPVTSNTLKVIDFGIAALFDPPSKGVFYTKAGTPDYVAPEVLDSWWGYGPECDLWSAGVVMYAVLSASLPFSGKGSQALQRAIMEARYSMKGPVWNEVSDAAKKLIRQLLVRPASRRLTAAEAMEDPWIQGEAVPPPSTHLMAEHVAAFKRFRQQNLFKKVALNVVARSLEEDRIEKLRDLFNTLDANGDGTLTDSELRDALIDAGLHEDNPELQHIMEAVDADGSGEIDYTEFLAATLDRRLHLQEHACKYAFRVFDKDDDGRISPDELRQILQTRDVRGMFGKHHVEEIMAEVDTNKDGFIDFNEFMHMMHRDSHKSR